LEDPEAFFKSVRKPLVVLDEVHQLPDPSRILKIATDAFPHLRVLATGSSTLAASRKFRDTLTGRKRVVALTPVLAEEMEAFGITDMEARVLRGGLPPALLRHGPDWEFYSEWLDSYFARDVQELFHVGKRAEFLRMVSLVLRQSGGLLEITSLAKHTGASRPTVMTWLDVLQITQVARLVRPFSGGGRREIIAQPLWRFGGHLQRLLRHPLVTPAELDETAKRVAVSPTFKVVGESLELLHTIPQLNLDRVLAIARATPGFVATYRQICERLDGTKDGATSTDDFDKLIGQQGLAKVVTLVAIARVARSLPQNGPINYQRVYAHSLATSLLAFEIGRFLKLERSFSLPSAGLLHDAGRWLFGLGEPGVFGLALALSEGGQTTVEQAESALFGVDARAAGRLLLVTAGHSSIIQEVASWHHDPAGVTEPDFVIAATVVHLAQILARAAAAGSTAESKAVHTRLAAPDYPAWQLLQERGVSLPFDPPERVDTLVAIAATCTWVANQFIEHGAGGETQPSQSPFLLAG
jgi:hypothetical protein